MTSHAERQHALLSASSAHRWLHCPPCARLEETFPDTSSVYAEEGTLAHEIAELKLRKKFIPSTDSTGFAARMNELKQHALYKSEMQKFTDAYIDYLTECAMEYPHAPTIAAEQKVEYSRWVPEGFGICDCVMIGDDTLHIIDFKYGKGVPVSAEDNPQLRLYAAGALDLYSLIYQVNTVKLSIVQPRLGNISQDTLSAKVLLEWMDTVVKPVAQLAYKGEGSPCAGDWCRFCRARSQCSARAETNLDQLDELANIHGYATPASKISLLRAEDISYILQHVKPITEWFKDVEKGALDMILHGESVPGWKIVEGRSNRTFSNSDAAFQALREAGIAEELLYKPKEYISLSAAEKLVGKTEFAKLCGNYICKPQGAPTLVPENDIRPALPLHSVEEDFSVLSSTT